MRQVKTKRWLASQYVWHQCSQSLRTETACGEPWQGWQAPPFVDRWVRTVPPYSKPGPGELLVPCPQCEEARR